MGVYNQMRNMVGIYDNDELNTACLEEDAEDLWCAIGRELRKFTDGERIWDKVFDTEHVKTMLKDKFDMEYLGTDEEREVYIFENEGFRLEVCPSLFYAVGPGGKLRLTNYHVMYK